MPLFPPARGVDIPRRNLSNVATMGAGITDIDASYAVRDGRVYFTGRVRADAAHAQAAMDGSQGLFTVPAEILSFAKSSDIWMMSMIYDVVAAKAIVGNLFYGSGSIYAQSGVQLQTPYVVGGICDFYVDGLEWDI